MKKLIFLLIIFLSPLLSIGQTQTFKTKVKFENVEDSEIQDSARVMFLSDTGILQSVPKYKIITQAQQDWIRSQMYENHSASISVSPSSGERGVNTLVTVSYSIASNDDVITSASINNGIGSVLSDVDQGSKSVSGGMRSNNVSWTLAIGYTRNGTAGSQNRSGSYTTYVPKWYGASQDLEDVTVNDYSVLTDLTKVVNSATSLSYTHNTNTDEYVWFISTSNITKITASGFDTSVANWGDSESFFWKKTLTGFKLANGTDTTTLYLYRTRVKQNTGGNNIPYIFNP